MLGRTVRSEYDTHGVVVDTLGSSDYVLVQWDGVDGEEAVLVSELDFID